MSTITTRDGVPIHYKDWGAGRPVVFIHGWPLNADMWDAQMHHLASRGLRCIAYDRRGFGRSGQPWHGYDYDTLADDLAVLLDTLDLHDATLVGFSMGCGEVARYVARHGTQRVAKAVLIGTVTPLIAQRDDHPEGVDTAVFDGIRAALVADRAAFVEGFWPLFTGSNRAGSTISRAALDWTTFMALQAGLKGTIDCVRAFSETDFRADLGRFALPTLVIHGDDDQTAPLALTAAATVGLVPHATLRVYEGAPHALYLTHAERLAEDLLAFVET
ncbi:arylesterase [Burkholderia ubonensis]|uniref:alpha/beta fold hydrolase n=1 Tax=Burkholderia ubonensis TaxID=101571 RepID=UPI000756DAFA|nr:alpha/beta hydrolase [Burkholderia ubonensis]KWE50380.1 arylesterase [Burkholderia ubonensis]KWE56872.1 arylesterase [Burkholderia ubonensis]KWE69139.1 arylesterase [Burkholderia ubonensis]